MIRPYSRAFAMIAASVYFMILAGCGGGDSGPTSPTPPTPTPPAPPPTPVATSITVAPSSHTLASIGATVQLAATVRDQNNNTMTGQTVNWTSSNTAVATVSGNGLVTAVSNGTTQITARAGNASGTANITVAEPVPTRIAVTPSSQTLEAIGATVQLRATVRDQRNNVMSGQTITWSSGNEAVATVDGNGLVTAVGNGMTEITASTGGLSANAAITVASPVATSLKIEPAAHKFEAIGDTLQLTAVVLDQRENAMMDVTLTWSSGDEAVATVDENGLVTAVDNGMAEITAQSGSLSANAAISVAQRPVTITITPSYPKLNAPGQMIQLEATVLDRNEVPVEGLSVSWHSSNPEVATISADGLLTAVSPGLTQITASVPGLEHSTTAAVELPSPDRTVLIALYNAMDGPNWERQRNWLSEEPIESWQGVVADPAGRVRRLLLTGNSLSNEIPVELAQLTYLEDLHLSSNQISGGIPDELAELQQLKKLHLDDNQMTGTIPPELGRLNGLTSIWLRQNQFSGAIPVELTALENLETLVVSENRLTGVIPSEIGQLGNLSTLELNDNQLTGGIPKEIGLLDQLTSLQLGNNQLTGSIPPELGEISKLEFLYLYENELTGEIPNTLGQLDQLRDLFLHNNELTGTIPLELGQLRELSRLRLDSNELMGNVPPELGGLTKLILLFLSMNEDLTGTLPREFLNLNLNSLILHGTQICVPPDAEFQAWLAGIMDAQGITACEVEDGGDGGEGGDGEGGEEIEYVSWEGVTVERGKLIFSASGGLGLEIEYPDCFTNTRNPLAGFLGLPPEGLKDWTNSFTNDTLTVHYSEWQRSDDMGSTWESIEGTRVLYDACTYNPEVAGEYRLVGEITLNDDRSFRRSENTFVVDP